MRPLSAQIGQEDRRIVAENEAEAVAPERIEDAAPVEVERGQRPTARHLDVDPLDAVPMIGPSAARDRIDLVLAIDGDMPAMLDEEEAEMLGEGLEAAMRGRYAARAQNDHGSSGRHQYLTASRNGCLSVRLLQRAPRHGTRLSTEIQLNGFRTPIVVSVVNPRQ